MTLATVIDWGDLVFTAISWIAVVALLGLLVFVLVVRWRK